jgi:ribose 5-phosphate isomerase A
VDHQLNCVKGGGACHLREKVLAEAATTFALFFSFFSLAKFILKASSLLGIIAKTSSILAPMYLFLLKCLLNNNFSSPQATPRSAYRSRTICLCQGASGSAP